MKKSTLILFLVALLGGALVYYTEIKPGKPRDEEKDLSREAFKLNREDINQIVLTRAGQTVTFENKDNKWLITQPLNALADESTINTIIGDLVSARITRDIPATAEQLKNFGLTEPKVKLEVKLKNGQSHKIELGDKDFSGSAVYAKIDSGQSIASLSGSLLTSADKDLKDLRDRSVLGGLSQYDIKGLKLSTESGPVNLSKEGESWKLTAPVSGNAEETEVNSLLSEITSAKAADVVSESADDLAKYGLNASKIGVTAQLTSGGERALNIGSKVDEQYYAKVSDRPQIYKIEKALYDKLNVKLAALRSKEFLKVSQDDVTRVQLKNPNGTLVVEADKDHAKWLIKEPADKKDKEATAFKIFTPLQSKAEEVLDKPSAAILAKLAKPAVTVKLTFKDGKTAGLNVSAADGDSVYVRVDGNPAVYKLNKTMLESLSFKLDEVVSGT
ncbi:MAG: DUF4340 domain-containing protein [Acidobacteria bacterium]|nr:DUF4340 domain-containing protein [Acidobacteriota bacterium]MBI3426057.1 DUF4340 domain-containing protein [Acidobacteriota bacterium]